MKWKGRLDIIMARNGRTDPHHLRCPPCAGGRCPIRQQGVGCGGSHGGERLTQIRKEGATRRFDVRRLLQVFGFINTSQHIGEFLLDVLNRPEYPTDGNENGQEARFTGKP